MKKSYFISILLFLMLIPMLLRSDYVTEGARYGLLLWYNSVVPALFPFMVLSGLIVSQGGVNVLMAPFYQMIRHVLPLSKSGCYILVIGFLCGYPMGAKTCADFLLEGMISEEEANFLMAICNHPSPMFLLGYVYPFFSVEIPVWILLLCVYAPVLILALISKTTYFRNNGKREYSVPSVISNKTTADEAILSAVTILCKIGGYLVLFSILIIFLRHAEWIPDGIRLFLIGALEMTTGIRELVASLPPSQALIGSVAALTFGGCSGFFQTKAVIQQAEKKAGLSIRPYIIWKLLHAGLSAGFAAILCN